MKLSQKEDSCSLIGTISVIRGTIIDGTQVEPCLILSTKDDGDIQLSSGLISQDELQVSERNLLVQIKGKKTGKSIVVDDLQTIEVLSGHIRPAFGDQPWIVLLCQFSDSPEIPPESKNWFENILSNVRPGLNHFFSDISYGMLNTTFDVKDWRRLPKSRVEYPSDEGDLLSACTDLYPEIDFTKYYGVIMVLDRGLNSQNGRAAGLGTGRTARIHEHEQFWGIVWLGSNGGWNNLYVWAQEMGHTYGLRHTMLKSNMSSRSKWDFMGTTECNDTYQGGCLPQHTTSYQKDSIGWLDDSRSVTISESIRELKIASLSNPNENGYLYAKVLIPGEDGRYYAVESRERSGYDQNIPKNAPNSAIVIHEINQALNPESYTVGSFTLNEEFEGDNVQIKVVEVSGTGHLIKVVYAPQPPIVRLEFAGCASGTARFISTVSSQPDDTVTSLQISVRYQGSSRWTNLSSNQSAVVSASSNQRVYLRAKACNQNGCSSYSTTSAQKRCSSNPNNPNPHPL